MNVELLQQVKQRILAEPEHFDMDYWVAETCGTVCCIGGWAARLSGFVHISADGETWFPTAKGRRALRDRGCFDDDPDVFAAALELEDDGATLFHVEAWPADLADRYASANSYFKRAQIAAERIDRFIATEGRE